MNSQEEKKLNKQQIEAVEFGKGPLLIIAGAGTGKTTVITERVKHLIAKNLAKPAEILALTFTEKAAREMEERIDIALPYGYTEMWISTFHSFCDRVLRNEALHIGLDPNYKLMTEAETIQFLIKNLFKFELKYFRPLGNPTKFIDGMLQHFSRLKDEDVSPEDYLNFARKLPKTEEADKSMELAKAYQKYEELKVKEGLMDFGDLIGQALKLFRTRKNVLIQYQKQFKYFLIDEFQDTNFSQYALIKELTPPNKKPNLTVVGDDSQCLPGKTLITTVEGKKRIDKVKVGEKILTAVGKGHTSISRILRIFERKKHTRFLTFILEDGKKITATDNHKMFCYLPSVSKDKGYYFVYLMYQKNLGWRLGMTNDLPTRLRIEHHADKIIGIGSYKSEQEARFYEAYYAAKFGLPTVPFSPRPNQAIEGTWLKRLFSEIDTIGAAKKLAKELHLELDSPNFMVDGVYRGVTDRVKVNLQMCYRNHRCKIHKNGFVNNPQISHVVWIETSSPTAIKTLEKEGITLKKAKKGMRFRYTSKDLSKAWEMAEKLVNISGGFLDKKFAAGTVVYQSRLARIVPASHVLPGTFLPVVDGKKVLYKKVTKRIEEEKEIQVYDLEIDRTHNFVANGVVVHNSIYKFRGAAISNILQFMKDYPKAKQVVLTINYRSTQTILDQAYQLIKHNDPDTLEAKLGISKDLRAVRKIKEVPVEFIWEERVENEAETVAKEIENCKLKIVNLEYKDFAILVRANNHADPFVRALARAGIPYQFLGPGQLFRQPEVKNLIAYLKVLYNFEDSVALYLVLSQEIFGISARDLAAINNFARRRNLSVFESCEQIDKIFVSQATKEKIKTFVAMVYRHLKLIPKETAGQILYYYLQDTGLLKKLADTDTALEERQAQNMAKFFDRLKTYEVDHEDATVPAVVDWLNLSMTLGESPLASNVDWTEENRVNLLTIHSAKGLEFPVVFLVNLVAGRFPTRERREQIPIPEALIKEILPVGDYHQEEERRLFYVGMTRAKDRLYLTAANYYGDGKRERKISPYVIEALGGKAVNSSAFAKASADKQLSIFDFKPTEIAPANLSANRRIDYLSYSQIESFNTCPLSYKFRYLYQIPVPPSSAQSFGDSIHKALRDFYQQVIKDQHPSLKDLLAFLQANWVNDGYKSKAHEKKMKLRGEKMLTDYFNQIYNPKIIPQSLEQIFRIRISPNLRLGGKIDRVDVIKDGLEIVDYKTGRPFDQKKVDQSLQMTTYALAAIDKGIYNRKPEEVVMSFYFLETGQKLSTKRTMAQLDQARQGLAEKAKEIEKSNFPAKPSQLCKFCDYQLLCDAWK